MKLTTKNTEKQTNTGNSYPCLMKLNRDTNLYEHNTIVLFTKDSVGTVVDTSNVERTPAYPVGEYAKTWQMNYFVPFTGSVTLVSE